MSNTYSTAAENLAVEATSAISTLLAPFASIAKAFPLEPLKDPALPRVVAVVKSVADTQLVANPDYTLGDATINPTTINHTLFTQPFGIGCDELDLGARLAWLYQLNGQKIAAALSDAISALLTTANYGAPVVTCTAANFAVSDFETLYNGVATAGRTIILDTSYFAKVKPASWCPPGFTSLWEHTRWSAAGANVRGFVSDPAAIVISYAIPNVDRPGRQVMAMAPFTIPQIGLQGMASIYYLTATRRLMGCLSLQMGAAPGDTNALKLLVSA
ncbi:MAG: hypothetical protein ABSF10_16005 [Verrucomicrobiota bacterium]|jgi:hypothetical protein